MRILKKLAAAAAIVMAISTLAACGNDSPELYPQNPGTPNPGTNSFDANNIADELNGQILKSKVTSADSTAKELITSVNTWIADDVASGGAEKRACELRIVMDNGKATITDASGKNNWEGKKGNPEKNLGCYDTLEERFEADYSSRTFTACVFIDESGYAIYSWFVLDDPTFNGAAPTRADFEAGEYEWKAEDRVGMTRGGTIMGTSPRLPYPKSLQKPSEPFSKPVGWTNADGLNAAEIKGQIGNADSTAKEIITTVNSWIAENVAAGGAEKTACKLRIVMKNGKAVVSDLSMKNDWEKRDGCPESLKERFESDWSGRTFTAGVIIDDSGYAVYAWYVPNDPQFNGAAPAAEDFRAGHYNWGFDIDGLTSEKVIIGTYPKLAGGADERY